MDVSLTALFLPTSENRYGPNVFAVRIQNLLARRLAARPVIPDPLVPSSRRPMPAIVPPVLR
jgi:hypothetical protein